MRGTRLIRLAGLVVLVGALVAATIWIGVPGREQLRGDLDQLGWWAPIAFVGLYAAVSLSPLPKTVFTLAAGALFGVAGGLAVVVAGALIGAVVAFHLGRFLGRDTLHRLTGGREDLLLSRHGVRAVLFARLVPIVPFTATNYLAGATNLRLRDFVLGTAVGILPTTAAYVTIGAYGWQPGAWPLWVAVGTLVVLTAGGVAVDRYRRRRAAGPPRPESSPEPAPPGRSR